MRERGLKQQVQDVKKSSPEVAPHAGAWIETFLASLFVVAGESLPMRERGLKRLQNGYGLRTAMVAPHAGAWIETSFDIAHTPGLQVAPHAGAWIETC